MLSPLRILVFAAVCATGVSALFWYAYSSEGAQWPLIWILEITGPLLLAISAETDERAPRDGMRRRVPWVLSPFIPGNGRGVVFALMTILAVLGWFLVARTVHEPGAPLFGDDDPTQLAAICLFAMIYCLLVARFARHWPQGFTRFKWLVLTVCCAFLAILVLGLASALLPKGFREVLRNLLVPIGFLEEVRQDGRWTWQGHPTFVVLCCIFGILFVANLPRMGGGIAEVVRLRRQQRIAVI